MQATADVGRSGVLGTVVLLDSVVAGVVSATGRAERCVDTRAYAELGTQLVARRTIRRVVVGLPCVSPARPDGSPRIGFAGIGREPISGAWRQLVIEVTRDATGGFVGAHRLERAGWAEQRSAG